VLRGIQGGRVSLRRCDETLSEMSLHLAGDGEHGIAAAALLRGRAAPPLSGCCGWAVPLLSNCCWVAPPAAARRFLCCPAVAG